MELSKADHVLDQLDKLDIMCENEGVHAELIIIGGSGLLLLLEMIFKQDFRPTRDVDVQILSANDMNELYRLLKEANIHIVGGVAEFPPIEDFREKEKYKVEAQFTNIEVYVPTPELLACTKIFSKRPKDLTDLQRSQLLDFCDLDILRDLIEDYKSYMLNPNDRDINVHQIEEILKQRASQLY
ncbi:hypothetical protein BIV60_15385 [Bacillus sp. MUM 116]|uniref:DUF6036 family nucleotidyltransferase n=1 Tax=Bacillus sp. MUM 116 TaxID=1678002 RepID=UPI0008F5E89F|nr:DUF6036 family nucleotidyltransferase [Bacillus sp. MUM 116]OIK12905.1 hypothetical protein BIV60_15385 [Bacillus sp. MUM 116]